MDQTIFVRGRTVSCYEGILNRGVNTEFVKEVERWIDWTLLYHGEEKEMKTALLLLRKEAQSIKNYQTRVDL